ncbi:MAG: hybrid sensor histidine kinase/response regulator [Myxococcota bacterium]
MMHVPSREHTLLILDDELDILDALYRLFRNHYQVLTTTDVDKAFEMIDTNPISVVMSDQRLFQRMTGVDFLSEVRNRSPDTVRMLFTGYASLEAVVDAINSGRVYGYITKPWTPRELKAKVAQAVEHYDLKQDRKQLLHELKLANIDLERKNAQLAAANNNLQNLDRMKNVFMEIVSHELNTPTAIILGYTYLLQREHEERDGDSTHPALGSIRTSANRLKNIAHKIFTVMSAESPQATLDLEEIALADLFEGVHTTVKPFLDKRDQTLQVEVDPQLHAVVDPLKIQDALYHLVMNAIKFSPDGYTIMLQGKPSQTRPGMIDLQVIDQGTGIQEQDQPQIFQSFFGTFKSWHHSSGEFEFEKRGIGLGLTIAKRFAEMHGGEATVQSSPGQGSTFTLTLPRRQRL